MTDEITAPAVEAAPMPVVKGIRRRPGRKPGWRPTAAPPVQAAAVEAPKEIDIEASNRLEMDKAMKDRIVVVFPETSEPDGAYRIKAGVNGRSFFIKRNEEVKLPRCVVEMLGTREILRYQNVGEKDRDGNIIYKQSRGKRFPYQVIRDPA